MDELKEGHSWRSNSCHTADVSEAVMQTLARGEKRLGDGSRYAATPNTLSTNFACPYESLPSNLFTCPFLIMCIDSTPSSVRSAV
jgi:hypothetical protein